MFSERLENLIKATLQDGILSEQEKATLIKRAQAEGEDIAEVDIYIQSLLQARQQELDKIKKKEKQEQEKIELEEQKTRDALMRKCPVCGEIITGISNVCPHCKHVLVTNTLDKASEDKVKTLMQRISNASTHLQWYGAELKANTEYHYIDGFDYMELEREGDKELGIHEYLPEYDSRKYYWIERFDYYFSDMNELETFYGELPTVKNFIHNQKVNEIKLLDNTIQREFRHGNSETAKSLISTLSAAYLDVPEAQIIYSNYQKQLEKQAADDAKNGKFLLIYFIVAIVVLVLGLVLESL